MRLRQMPLRQTSARSSAALTRAGPLPPGLCEDGSRPSLGPVAVAEADPPALAEEADPPVLTESQLQKLWDDILSNRKKVKPEVDMSQAEKEDGSGIPVAGDEGHAGDAVASAGPPPPPPHPPQPMPLPPATPPPTPSESPQAARCPDATAPRPSPPPPDSSQGSYHSDSDYSYNYGDSDTEPPSPANAAGLGPPADQTPPAWRTQTQLL